MEKLQIRTDGDVTLAMRLYRPDGTARAGIVIGGAMGVRQGFYETFAKWLAAQGFLVATFDYRGTGDSLPPGQSMRDVRADLFDWAHDYEAVIDAVHARLDGAPLYLFGHSLGAQLPGLLRDPQRVSGLLSIAAGSGYWRDNAPQLRRSILYFWYVLVPIATRLFGYFPGRKLRKVGDLPSGVMLQWRKWCLNPLYSVGAEGEPARARYGAVRFPVIALSITDDELMTLRGTQTLLGLYANAPNEVQRIAPADVQARRIGHFGFFREQFAGSLWPRAVESLAVLADIGHPGAPGVAQRTA